MLPLLLCLLLAAEPAEDMPIEWGKSYQLEQAKKFTTTLRVHPRIAPYTITFGDGFYSLVVTQPADSNFSQQIYFEPTVPYTHWETDDYNLDDYQDFRVLQAAGSGGSWYEYFLYSPTRKRFYRSEAFYGIDSIDPDTQIALASVRSGPAWNTAFFQIDSGKPNLFKTKTFDQVQYLRQSEDLNAIIPKSLQNSDFILITTFYRNGKITRRYWKTVNIWDPNEKYR